MKLPISIKMWNVFQPNQFSTNDSLTQTHIYLISFKVRSRVAWHFIISIGFIIELGFTEILLLSELAEGNDFFFLAIFHGFNSIRFGLHDCWQPWQWGIWYNPHFNRITLSGHHEHWKTIPVDLVFLSYLAEECKVPTKFEMIKCHWVQSSEQICLHSWFTNSFQSIVCSA